MSRRLRRWQQEALAAYQQASPRDWLVTATPGAGKTTFALALAADLLESRTVDRVVVVCPTDHLRQQWAAAASHAGITLDPTLSNQQGGLSDDFVGYVCTYAQVAAKPMLHRRRVENRRWLFLGDELHHAGDGLSWGDAVYEAFEPARRRVALTGTPFRTKPTERIPFVRYVEEPDGALRSDADFEYGYRQALADQVVRPVLFAAYTGTSRWMNSAGEVLSASLGQADTKEAEDTAWRVALDPRGQWIPHVVAAADERLTYIRAAGMPDAAGLMLASDQESARAYARIVAKVTGHEPVLVTSDDPKASQKIADFADSSDRWVIAVRMISEGVDLPRCAVQVWATSYRTPLFFAQAVGRVVRSRRPGEVASVFVPAVRQLLALAADLESERNHVIAAPPPGDDLLDPLPLDGDTSNHGGWEALDAEAEFAHVLYAGRAVTADPYADLAADDAEFLGLPGLLSPEQTAALLARRETQARARAGTAVAEREATGTRQEAAWQTAAALRREINALVARHAARTGAPHAKVHADVRKAVPGPPSASATVEQLTARRDWLLERVR